MAEEKLIREGVVSSVNETLMTARVTFEDRDNVVSAEYAIMGRGSTSMAADYWLPSVGDVAVCLCAPNGEESGEGWIIGTRYTEQSPPVKSGGRRLTMGNGTTVEMLEDGANITVTGDVNITATGSISVRGAMIYLNEDDDQ